MILLKTIKHKKLFYFNSILFCLISFLMIYPFLSKNITVKNKTYLTSYTYFYPGDATGSTDTLHSGKKASDFTVGENGWYYYNNNGKTYLVIAAATVECRDSATHCGISTSHGGYATKIPYYHLYDTVVLNLGGKAYDAMILDSCGACMWGVRDSLGERFDIFSTPGGKNPAVYDNSDTAVPTNPTPSVNPDDNPIINTDKYTGDIKQGYIYLKQGKQAVKDFEEKFSIEQIENTVTKIINLIFRNTNISLGTSSSGPTGDAAYDPDVTYLTGSFRNPIIYFNQGDYPNSPYGSFGTIKSHGCGPTSMAIVVSSFRKQAVSPVEVTNWTCSSGHCTSDGTTHAGICAIARHYGLNCSGPVDVTNTNVQPIINALASGNSLVVVLARPGYFTTGGHFFVLTGVTADNKISVADPGSRKRTGETFTMDFLITPSQGHVAKYWIISG